MAAREEYQVIKDEHNLVEIGIKIGGKTTVKIKYR